MQIATWSIKAFSMLVFAHWLYFIPFNFIINLMRDNVKFSMIWLILLSEFLVSVCMRAVTAV